MFRWLFGGRPVLGHSRKRITPRDQSDVPLTFRIPDLCGHDLYEISVERLRHHFEKGDFTCAEYTDACIRRIQALNAYLEAVIEINPDALDIAARLDQERCSGKIRGPLHGVPVLVKDNIATNDSMQTTAGSWALLGSIVPRDAKIVSLLREAGAVVLGHTNMSEWASCRSKKYSTGYSPRGGQVRNPYDHCRTPFGSSSGSAVAVAANLVPVSVGTETDTSIIGPASINGVVGFKPTVGFTSRAGVIPVSENMDSVGTFGRTMSDAVLAMDAIAAEDTRDPYTRHVNRATSGSLSTHLTTSAALRGARFGRPAKRCWDMVPEDCKMVTEKVFEVMTAAGAEIVDVELPSIEERIGADGGWDWEHGEVDECEWTVAKVDAYNGINAYLQDLKISQVRSVEDVVQYNQQNAGTEGPAPGLVAAFPTGHDNLIEIVETKGQEDDKYHTALEHIHKQTRENGIDAAVRGVDALLFCDRKGIGQQYAAQAGYPIVCIPIGLDREGLPVSLSIQHTAWKEAELVKWASAIEDLWKTSNGPRATPTYQSCYAKNIPIKGL